MDMGAISKGKHKGKGRGKHKGKKGKKGNKGKGYGSYSQHQQGNYNSQSTKGKGKIGQGMPFKGQHDKAKGKSYSKSTGQGKGHIVCYKCGQPGHTMKNCRVSVYNINEGTQNNDQNVDTTQQWYEQSNDYDSHWWNHDQSPSHQQQTSTEDIEGVSSAIYTNNRWTDNSAAVTTAASIANYGLTDGNSTNTSTSTSSTTSPKRTLPDEIAEGSSSKQTRRQEAPTGLTRPEATAQPATSRQRDHGNYSQTKIRDKKSQHVQAKTPTNTSQR